MDHIIDLDKQRIELEDIFKKVQNGNTILLLGAGASVGEKRYLSQEIIEYYEQMLGYTLEERDITKFVDMLSSNSSFSRSHFDNFVFSLLQKLSVTEAHKILATIPWRQIITTNYDLLVERAYDEVQSTHQKQYDLKVVRNIKQYNYTEANSEVKYIKLNGCMQDKGLYPFAFSTTDFSKLRQYYKLVINDLKNVSSDIQFLSVGYSYKDKFGQELLQKFDSYNYRDKRWIFNVDPYPNENALAYYKDNKICIVKCSFEEFLNRYKIWEDEQNTSIAAKRGLSITNSSNTRIAIPPKLLVNLDGILKQLNIDTRDFFVKDVDFYKGEEPNFNIITRGADVIKQELLLNCQNKILEIFKETSTFLPIIFIVGDFGIGKSTFSLRLIYELEKKSDLDLVAFEILDYNRLKKEYLVDLIKFEQAKNIIFFCDDIERESNFKALMDLQRELSIEQIQDTNIFFVAPMRENIYEKFKIGRSLHHAIEIKMSGKLVDSEIEDLLEKLLHSGLVDYRDASEKGRLVHRISQDFDSDSFIALMSIITGGKHENDLVSSYNQLSKEAQNAFLYTALLHKHKLHMPASWLKQNISMSWDEFEKNIIRAEGKGILIQEIKTSRGTQPDLYFKTKHPLIAEKLVNIIIPSKDRQFKFYERMLKTIEQGVMSSFLAIDLLKSFVRNEEYSSVQLNFLYDAAYTKLSDDPYFLLNYAINSQKNRRTIKELEKILDLLVYAESLLDKRNHKFIHRRGVICFELAQLFYESNDEAENVRYYLREAQDLFLTKQLLDPFSSYSYVDYIKMIIWELEKLDYEQIDRIQKHIMIEELLDIAKRTVTDDIDRITKLSFKYGEYLDNELDEQNYKEYLDEIYEDFHLKPYACILLYNFYESRELYDDCDRIIDEIENYTENFEVVKFLFKYYGRNLFDPNIRVKFLRLSRNNPVIEKTIHSGLTISTLSLNHIITIFMKAGNISKAFRISLTTLIQNFITFGATPRALNCLLTEKLLSHRMIE